MIRRVEGALTRARVLVLVRAWMFEVAQAWILGLGQARMLGMAQARLPRLARARTLAFAWMLTLVSAPAWAIDPEPPFEDPQLEAEYQALIKEVRCLVCQNQTIADSNAPLAADLRREIREMMGEGATRSEVNEFLVARYGDFVLYRPRFQPSTWALWGGPAFFLILGMVVFARILRTRMAQPLDGEESP